MTIGTPKEVKNNESRVGLHQLMRQLLFVQATKLSLNQVLVKAAAILMKTTWL